MIRATGYLLWRLCRIIFGIAMLIVGVVLSLPGIPGPGIVLVVLGFGILSHHFHWAEKIHRRMKEAWQEVLNRYNKKNPSVKKESDHE
jgi:uncharacterized protein (TIGR02611 family)